MITHNNAYEKSKFNKPEAIFGDTQKKHNGVYLYVLFNKKFN